MAGRTLVLSRRPRASRSDRREHAEGGSWTSNASNRQGASRPVVAHVPHAATFIPDAVRADIVLDDAELEVELLRLTDWHTDRLFIGVLRHGASMFVNRLSRLVFDPERFADPMAEPMDAVGQGVVYTRTTSGGVLRQVDAAARTRTLRQLYDPYHAALTELVAERLAAWDRCTIIDCHSFATLPLPSEPDQSPHRPDVCIGTDAFHTPSQLADALSSSFAAEGFRVALDRPFSGALVPRHWYGRDRRVRAVMIEVRRGLYCDEASGVANASFEQVRAAIERALLRGRVFD